MGRKTIGNTVKTKLIAAARKKRLSNLSKKKNARVPRLSSGGSSCDVREPDNEDPTAGQTDSDQMEIDTRDESDVGDDEDRYIENSDGEDEGSEASDLEEDESALRVANQTIPIPDAEKVITALEKIVADAKTGRGNHKGSTLDDITRYRIRLMLSALRFRCTLDCGMMKASELAAATEGRKSWTARRIRQWIRHFQSTEMLPENLYGGRWNQSIIDDEKFRLAVKDYMRWVGKYAQARDVVDFFDTLAGQEWRRIFGGSPALRTAQSWMDKLGFDWGKERRGQYADGHEREDVVEYRSDYYIPEWFGNESRMRSWDEEGRAIPVVMKAGQRIVVKWFHDESTFYAHDRRTLVWNERGKPAEIKKKGEGLSMMVADFVSPDYGWLRGRENSDARVTFRAGKHRDGYFCSRDIVQQFLRAVAIVKDLYPDEDHVFIFDNATIHTKLPDNTPNAALMTLGPSKHVGMEVIELLGEKTRVKMAAARFADGSPQALYYPENHPESALRGQFKGLTKLLMERKIPGAQKLRLQCSKNGGRTGCPVKATDCCARRTMANQPDFLNQKTTLQLLAEEHGCSVVYLPKYHCELNPIEQCWGAAKQVYRKAPDSSSEADLKQNMLDALDSVSLTSIRRFAARSRRFLCAYRDGASGVDALWAQKLYHGHRVVTESVMNGHTRQSTRRS